MRNKQIAVMIGTGMSAIMIGSSVFAWQASTLDINGVESAGVEIQSDGCLVGDLLLNHNDPIYDTVLSDWFFTGVSVVGDTGSNATACSGYELKISYETLAGTTIQVGGAENLPATEMFNQAVIVADGQLPGVPTENIKNWQIMIADSGDVTAEAPTALSATAGNTTVALTWSAPTNNGGAAITDYVIEQRIGAGLWTVIADGTSTNASYNVTGLTNGTAYEFRVSTVNAVGTGTASSTANATPRTTAGAPTALSATAGNTTVALTWSAPTNNGGAAITDYVIEQRIGAGLWTVIADGTSTNASYNVTGLTNGTAYEFRISAVNAVGTGTPSTSASATPKAPAVGDIGPGGGLIFYDAGSTQSWGRYLEMAPKTWNGGTSDPAMQWGFGNVPSTQNAIGTGAQNTVLIDAALSTGAGQTAADLVLGGKSDWFLPSYDELNRMYIYSQTSGFNAATYGFSGNYHMSTQRGDTTVFYQNFPGGYVNYDSRGSNFNVRPIRAF